MEAAPRVLVIDHYDSFTWNLVQQLGALGAAPEVVRKDEVTVEEALARRPAALVLSPGPGAPEDTGVTLPLLARLEAEHPGLPVLGVCLGHQAMALHLGAGIRRAEQVLHGKTCAVSHGGRGLFAGLPDPMVVARYHSLLVEPEGLPSSIRPTAWSDGGELMAFEVAGRAWHGVQFHPESFLTRSGDALVGAFLARIRDAAGLSVAPVLEAAR